MSSKTRTEKLAPPEIRDLIIDYLHSEPETLKSVSLVCRAFVPSSRLHLFSTITLTTRSHESFKVILEREGGVYCTIPRKIFRLRLDGSPKRRFLNTMWFLRFNRESPPEWVHDCCADVRHYFNDIQEIYFTGINVTDSLVSLIPSLISQWQIESFVLDNVADMDMSQMKQILWSESSITLKSILIGVTSTYRTPHSHSPTMEWCVPSLTVLKVVGAGAFRREFLQWAATQPTMTSKLREFYVGGLYDSEITEDIQCFIMACGASLKEIICTSEGSSLCPLDFSLNIGLEVLMLSAPYLSHSNELVETLSSISQTLPHISITLQLYLGRPGAEFKTLLEVDLSAIDIILAARKNVRLVVTLYGTLPDGAFGDTYDGYDVVRILEGQFPRLKEAGGTLECRINVENAMELSFM